MSQQPSPSSPPEPDSAQPNHESSPNLLPPKKTPPLPWTHLETVHLIEVYQEKWYSLKRGQLKASQWEDVANTVAARCGYIELSKSATQCRHKMEKLRKRYRSEKQKFSSSAWPYFDLMDLMERGPFPISVRPISSARPIPPSNATSPLHWNEEDDVGNYRSRSSPNHMFHRRQQPPPVATPIFDRKGYNGGIGGPGVSRFMNDPMLRKRRRSYEIEEEEEEEEVEEEGEEEIKGGEAISELASVVRAFGEGFVRIENMKLEIMKETERYRMQMERKRTEMILESQHRIVDAIARALKKANKTTQEV